MKINRLNYEEYFLLYVDNELSSADRRMVEEFAGRHPDLREELDLLLQFRAEPEEAIAFPDKTSLYKTPGTQLVNDGNYTEWLLLYTDNELKPEEKTAVEKYLSDNPAAAAELGLLLQTRIEPDSVSFPDKSTLYRREEKVRYFNFRYWRAAAVLLIGAGLTAAWLMQSPANHAGTETANNAKKSRQIENNGAAQGMANNNNANPDQKEVTPPSLKQEKISPNAVILARQEKNSEKALSAPVRQSAEKQNSPLIAQAQPIPVPSNNLPKPDQNPNVQDVAYNSNPVNKRQDFSQETVNPYRPLTNSPVTIQAAQPSNIIQAAYPANEEDGFAQNDGKKNKLRGLFRKVTRTFEKRTDIDPTDDNRLLVAGLSIKLK